VSEQGPVSFSLNKAGASRPSSQISLGNTHIWLHTAHYQLMLLGSALANSTVDRLGFRGISSLSTGSLDANTVSLCASISSTKVCSLSHISLDVLGRAVLQSLGLVHVLDKLSLGHARWHRHLSSHPNSPQWHVSRNVSDHHHVAPQPTALRQRRRNLLHGRSHHLSRRRTVTGPPGLERINCVVASTCQAIVGD